MLYIYFALCVFSMRTVDTAVADVALNILCLLMKDQWSWLCTENIQKTIRLLFGTFIERYVLQSDSVQHLACKSVLGWHVVSQHV